MQESISLVTTEFAWNTNELPLKRLAVGFLAPLGLSAPSLPLQCNVAFKCLFKRRLYGFGGACWFHSQFRHCSRKETACVSQLKSCAARIRAAGPHCPQIAFGNSFTQYGMGNQGFLLTGCYISNPAWHDPLDFRIVKGTGKPNKGLHWRPSVPTLASCQIWNTVTHQLMWGLFLYKNGRSRKAQPDGTTGLAEGPLL